MPRLTEIDWKDPGSRWTFIEQEINWQRQYRFALFREWFTDIAHYAGHQYISHDRTRSRLHEDRPPSWRVRAVNNLLMPQARQFVANMARIEPIWGMIPATRDPEDIERSILNKNVLHHFWQNLKIYKKYVETLFWTATTGNGYLKATWDPELGNDIEEPEDDQLLRELFAIMGVPFPDQGKPKIGLKTGDHRIGVVPPFQLTFQRGVTNHLDSLFTIESNVRDPYIVEDKYKKKVAPEGDSQSLGVWFHEKIQELTSKVGSGYISTDQKDKVVVHEVFVRPHRQLKDGMHFIMAQGEDLKPPAPFPYEHGETVYFRFPEVEVPGRLDAVSTLHQNKNMQAIHNRMISQSVEYVNLMNRPKWLVPRGARLQENALSDAPGGIIKYTAPFAPQQMKLSAYPRSAFDIMSSVKMGMQDTSSMHDPSQGKTAGSVRSGLLAQELKESDLSVLGPVQMAHDEELARLGVHILKTSNQYITEERLISIAREGQLSVSKRFTGQMLKGDDPFADYFNVTINSAGRAPWNKLGQQQLVIDMVQSGILRPGEHDHIIMKAVGLQDAQVVFEQEEQARTLQMDEMELLEQGQPVEVQKHEHHATHLTILRQTLESPAFMEKPDEVKQAYRKHYDDHMRMEAVISVLPALLQQQAVQQLSGVIGNGGAAEQPNGTGTGQPTGSA